MTEFEVPEQYGEIMCVNTDGEDIYVTCAYGYDMTICKFSIDGQNFAVIAKYEASNAEDAPLPPRSSVVDDCLYSVPIFGFGKTYVAEID